MDNSFSVEHVGYLFLITGVLALGFGMILPQVPLSVTHVDEFDDDYINESSTSIFDEALFGSDTGNETAEDIHPTYEYDNLTAESQDGVDRAINGDNTTVATDDFEPGAFIVEFEKSKHVLNAEPIGPPPTAISLAGVTTFILGILVLSYAQTRTRDDDELSPEFEELEKAPDDSEWDFILKDETEE